MVKRMRMKSLKRKKRKWRSKSKKVTNLSKNLSLNLQVKTPRLPPTRMGISTMICRSIPLTI